MRRIISGTLSWLKYIMAVFVMVAGIQTMFYTPLEPDDNLSFLYEHRSSLVALGALFFASGAVLLYGKVRKHKRLIGYGLLLIYLDFLFGFILNWMGEGFVAAVPNGVVSLLVAGLYLRWKYHIYYVTPPNFSVETLDKPNRTV